MFGMFGNHDLSLNLREFLREAPLVNFAIYSAQFSGNSRKDYLSFVMCAGVATNEEREEYAISFREETLKIWQEHSDKIQRTIDEENRALEKALIHQRKAATYLRQIGEFDLALKREEYISAMIDNKSSRFVDNKRFNYHFRGLNKDKNDWGDNLISHLMYPEK